MKRWKRAEERAADFSGGSLVRGSGCGRRKSDVSQKIKVAGGYIDDTNGYRIESKSSEREPFVFKTEWFFKITKEAKASGQTPALFIQTADLSAFILIPAECETVPLNAKFTSFSTEEIRTLANEKKGFALDNKTWPNVWQILEVE